jgi:hypothetical protein
MIKNKEIILPDGAVALINMDGNLEIFTYRSIEINQKAIPELIKFLQRVVQANETSNAKR